MDFTSSKLPHVRLHRSELTDLRGAESLRGAVIDPNQVVPLGLAMLRSLEVVVDDD